jgi:sialic acid synthase
VAAHPLKSGQVLGSEDVAIRSPGDGLPPFEMKNVLEKTLLKNLEQDENITFEILK